MKAAHRHCQVHVRQCSKCSGDTEFYCFNCEVDLCVQCKENHLQYFSTKDHNVVIYREKFNHIPLSEICVRHPNKVYTKFCKPCLLALCKSCSGHNIPKFQMCLSYFKQTKYHEIVNIRSVYRVKRRKPRKTINIIFKECLFHRSALENIDFYVDKNASLNYSENISTAKKVKSLITITLSDVTQIKKCRLLHKLHKQNIIGILTTGQLCEQINEQSITSPLQYLLFLKTSNILQILENPYQRNIKIAASEPLEMKHMVDMIFRREIKK